MKKLRLIRIVIQRVLITVSVFWAALMVIHFTAITPKDSYSPCKRQCNRADWPQICRYHLVIEKYSLPKFPVDHKYIISDENEPVGAGRTESHYFLVNGHHTGPTLEVCKNDFVVIDVENRIPGRSISIHWTGQTQRHTPFMDGVPMITQCPITSFTTFQYKFQADRSGTHLYHGFSKEERSLGMVGALLVHSVHEQSQHPLSSQCLDDLIWIVSEINGSFLINGNRSMVQMVHAGRRYRVRVAYVAPISLRSHCQRWLEIQDHNVTVIALDGNLIEPLVVERVALSDGNRVDLIVHTDERVVKQDYEIRFVATGNSVDDDGEGKGCHLRHREQRQQQPYAYGSTNNFRLKYVRTKPADSPLWPGDATTRASEEKPSTSSKQGRRLGFNVGQTVCSSNSSVVTPLGARNRLDKLCLLNLRARVNDARDRFPAALRDVDRRISLLLAKRKVEREIFGERFYDVSYGVNGFSFIYPSALMIQDSRDANLEQLICSNSSGYRRMPKKCHQSEDENCECVHVEFVETGHRVELIIVNEDKDSSHTYHLHGNSFFLVAAAQTDEAWQNQLQNVKRNFDRPVLLDTVRIDSGSMVVLRFVAANEGLWMLRDLGADPGWSRGLDVILDVRALETEIDIPDNFPKCRNFVGPKYFLI